MKVDYIAMMQEYRGHRNDGHLTDVPKPIRFAEDDYIRVRYDAKAMQKATDDFVLPRWIPSRPSRIKYPTAKELIEQYRREYAAKWG